MSIEREVINLTDSVEPLKEFKTPEEYEAHLVEVLSRDQLADRLNVKLPDDVHGEWVRDDPVSIAAKKAIGYKIDDKYAVDNALHNDGGSIPRVGDVIFMTIPKDYQTVFEKVRQRRLDEHHGVRDSRGKTSVEKQFEADAEKNETPAVNQGSTRRVNLQSLD